MTQRKYLFLGLAAMLALAITTLFVARELTVTSARTTDATMTMTVSSGGACVGSTCTVALGAAFKLRVITAVPIAEGYIGWGTEVDYSALVASGGSYKDRATAVDEMGPTGGPVFAGAPNGLPLRTPANPNNEGLVNHGNVTGLIAPPETLYSGPILELDFNCSASNSSNVFNLVPLATGNTNASGYKQSQADGAGNIPAKTTPLTIVCGAVGVTPTQTPTIPSVGPTATPTATSVGPTNTPGPTATVTNTPGATNTPGPTATRTNTPVATATRTPTPQTGGMNGDSNCDGEITSIDALWVLWDVANLSDFIPCPENADANKDGNITSVDSALILQDVAGLYPL